MTMQTTNVKNQNVETSASPVLVSLKYLQTRASASGSYIWKGVREGTIPPPVVRAPRFTRWRKSDADAWLTNPSGWRENILSGAVSEAAL